MIKFIQFILEARRSQNLSPSRREYLARQSSYSRENKFKSQLPKFSEEELDDHIADNFKFELIDKVKNSSHDPKAPINMTRPMPDSVRALTRAAIFHFEDGVRKTSEGLKHDHQPTYQQGKKQIFAASRLLKKYVGDHYHSLMVDNKTRPILKNMMAKNT